MSERLKRAAAKCSGPGTTNGSRRKYWVVDIRIQETWGQLIPIMIAALADAIFLYYHFNKLDDQKSVVFYTRILRLLFTSFPLKSPQHQQ